MDELTTQKRVENILGRCLDGENIIVAINELCDEIERLKEQVKELQNTIPKGMP